MNHESIRLDFEKQLTQELYDQFDAGIISGLLKEAKIEQDQTHLKALLDGNSFKISAAMFSKMHRLCQEVLSALDFHEKVDFYISNNMEINCYAIYNENHQNHIVIINSPIVEKFDDDEIKFILGHEIGHLISENAKLRRIINYVYPDYANAPLIFKNKIDLWEKLSELTADRFGYIASPNFEKCVTNFFKLSSGLNLDKLEFNSKSYLLEIDAIIKNMQENPVNIVTSHPINPIRIKALDLFRNSRLYKNIDNADVEKDETLSNNMVEYLSLLIQAGSSGLDYYRKNFLAAGGLIIASADQRIDDIESNKIITTLAGYTVFSKEFYYEMWNSEKDLQVVFEEAINTILSVNPGERHIMFSYLVELAISDNEIFKTETDLLFIIGEQYFNFERKEIAQMITNEIRSRYVPKILK